MKKFIILLLLCSQWIQAQDTIPKSVISSKKNEIRVDVLSLATARYNLTYERFLGKNFSVGLSGRFSSNKKVKDDFNEGNINTYAKYEVIPFVRYNLSQGSRSFYFAEIFTDINGGDFREIVLLNDATNNSYYVIQKSKYSDLGIGAAVGYKYYIKDQFGIELLVGSGANLFNKDKSPDVLSRVGLGVSYRF